MTTKKRTLLTLSHRQCRWCLDHQKQIYCGQPTIERKSFCQVHAEIAYQKTPYKSPRPVQTISNHFKLGVLK